MSNQIISFIKEITYLEDEPASEVNLKNFALALPFWDNAVIILNFINEFKKQFNYNKDLSFQDKFVCTGILNEYEIEHLNNCDKLEIISFNIPKDIKFHISDIITILNKLSKFKLKRIDKIYYEKNLNRIIIKLGKNQNEFPDIKEVTKLKRIIINGQ
jgi:hypothetical protein